jgi:hypothetical protein
MTIDSAKNIIVPMFLESDVLTLRDICVATTNNEATDYDQSIFELALDALEAQGAIKKFKKEPDLVAEGQSNAAWVLVQPLISLKQFVEISGDCAVVIADTINSIIREFSFDKMVEANPYNITQADIEKLLLFLSEIKKHERTS